MAQIKLDNVCLNIPIYGIQKTKYLVESQADGSGNTGSPITFSKKQVVVPALKNINLELNDDTTVGIVGHNGSGKTTLLKLIANIYEPTSGRVMVDGKVSSIFSNTLGASPEFTGREIVFNRLIFYGFSREAAMEYTDEVAKRSGLGQYFDLPMRSYSRGMRTRLGFCAVVDCGADILLLDECFAAGDQNFLEMAHNNLEKASQTSSITILISHTLEILEKFCDVCIHMEAGRIKYIGSASEVIERYRASALA